MLGGDGKGHGADRQRAIVEADGVVAGGQAARDDGEAARIGGAL